MPDEDYIENEIKSIEFDIDTLKRKKKKLIKLKEKEKNIKEKFYI